MKIEYIQIDKNIKIYKIFNEYYIFELDRKSEPCIVELDKITNIEGDWIVDTKKTNLMIDILNNEKVIKVYKNTVYFYYDGEFYSNYDFEPIEDLDFYEEFLWMSMYDDINKYPEILKFINTSVFNKNIF